MKGMLIFIASTIISISVYGQVKMVITDVEIANHASDTTRFYDMIIIYNNYHGPRFLIRADIVNGGADKLFLSGSEDDNKTFTLTYCWGGVEKSIEAQAIIEDEDLGIGNAFRMVYPNSVYKLVVVVSDDDFPKENYCCAFYKVVPSMRLTVYTRRTKFPDDDILRPLESEKIDMNKVRIKCDLER